VAIGTRMHDAQNGDEEQDGEGHIGTDEGRGEDRGQDGKGGRGGMGERGEEVGDGAGEGRAHEGGEAERPDAGGGRGVVLAPSGPSVPFAASRGPRIPWRRGAAPTVSQVGACRVGRARRRRGCRRRRASAQGGVAQARERRGLDLAHALAGEPELLADLLQDAWGSPSRPWRVTRMVRVRGLSASAYRSMDAAFSSWQGMLPGTTLPWPTAQNPFGNLEPVRFDRDTAEL